MVTGHLDAATAALGLARVEALLRGDLHAAHRLGRLHAIVSDEAEYADGVRLGLPTVPVEQPGEWLPGCPDPETLARLGDAHTNQLERIEATA